MSLCWTSCSLVRDQDPSKMARLAGTLNVLLMLLLVGRGTSKHQIYVGGFLPFNEPNLESFRSIKAASDLALRQINSSPHILKDYHLSIIWNDSKCNPGVCLKEFFDMVHDKPTKMFIFGATCSPVTDIIAKAANYWKLIQV